MLISIVITLTISLLINHIKSIRNYPPKPKDDNAQKLQSYLKTTFITDNKYKFENKIETLITNMKLINEYYLLDLSSLFYKPTFNPQKEQPDGNRIFAVIRFYYIFKENVGNKILELTEKINKLKTKHFQEKQIYERQIEDEKQQFATENDNKTTTEQASKLVFENTRKSNIDALLKQIIILVYGIHIVHFRRKEGEYINGSVKRIREQIVDMLQIKNDDVTFLLPDYYYESTKEDVKSCKYCIDDNSNFCLIDNITSYKSADDIIKEARYSDDIKYNILSIIKESYDGTSNNNELFCKSMLFGILCVFNMSRKADPPKIPYININDLKKTFKKLDYKYANVDRATALNAEVDSDLITFVTNFDNRISLFTRIYGKNIVPQLQQQTNRTIYNSLKTYRNMIEYYEKWNESTSIGSLEFIDRMSKLNRVNVMCKGDIHDEKSMELLYNKEVADLIKENDNDAVAESKNNDR
jgi:hypothetical protein